MGILIFGLNGSGKTTLAKALAQELACKFMDIEEYAFLPAKIPYTKQRSREEVISLLQEDIRQHSMYILSAVKGNFGEEISASYELAVFLDLPRAIRLARVKQRILDKFGDRVQEGGDMAQSEEAFLNFVASRKLDDLKVWSATLTCPILHLDGRKELKEKIDLVKIAYQDLGRPCP